MNTTIIEGNRAIFLTSTRVLFLFNSSKIINMHLKVIVYNKTRNFAGHTIGINISATDTIKTLKEKIMEKTDIPIATQHITFGVQHLDDGSIISHYHIQNGYTVYCTPTYIEIPQQPSL